MTGSDVPRGVRVVTLLAWLMVPAGALLVCAGVLDLTWWASADAHRLTAVMAQIRQEYGVDRPALPWPEVTAGVQAVAEIIFCGTGIDQGHIICQESTSDYLTMLIGGLMPSAELGRMCD